MPAKCREAFALRKVHGLSQRQVAEPICVSCDRHHAVGRIGAQRESRLSYDSSSM
ncbi:MAG: hypothetical protein WDO56_24265 [Gammaproteobacteria bacterium]